MTEIKMVEKVSKEDRQFAAGKSYAAQFILDASGNSKSGAPSHAIVKAVEPKIAAPVQRQTPQGLANTLVEKFLRAKK